MAKGYWIVRLTVLDQAKYDAYRALNGEPLKRHGARFLVRGGAFEAAVGEARPRNIVIEFPSYEAALACFHAEDYQAAVAARGDGADMQMIIIEGYDGPQP